MTSVHPPDPDPSVWTPEKHGRRVGGLPPQIWGGGRPMHPSPQYFEKYCYWIRGKVQNDKNMFSGGFSGGAIEVFGQKRVNCYRIWASRERQKYSEWL